VAIHITTRSSGGVGAQESSINSRVFTVHGKLYQIASRFLYFHAAVDKEANYLSMLLEEQTSEGQGSMQPLDRDHECPY
jgi:hypothetical protein